MTIEEITQKIKAQEFRIENLEAQLAALKERLFTHDQEIQRLYQINNSTVSVA